MTTLADLMQRYYVPVVQQQIHGGGPSGPDVLLLGGGGDGGPGGGGRGGGSKTLAGLNPGVDQFGGTMPVGVPGGSVPAATNFSEALGFSPMRDYNPAEGGGAGGGVGSAGSPDDFVGRSDWIGYLASLAPFPISTVLGVGNAMNGLQAADRFAEVLSQVTGRPTDLTLADYLSAATGMNLSARAMGIGGYEPIGGMGIESALTEADPGAAGLGRAMGRNNVDIARGVNPASNYSSRGRYGDYSDAPSYGGGEGGGGGGWGRDAGFEVGRGGTAGVSERSGGLY